MRKSDKDVLIWYIRQLLHLEKDIDILSDEGVIHLVVKGCTFYLYIKSLTYAGNPYPLNTTRAQLPEREEFFEIKISNCVFLFLGYDEKNEVFACWDPIRTKERLNEKKYVSFFSRLNLQESVKQGNILTASLQNDFKYVLFKINDLAFFLLHIQDYFPDVVHETIIEAISEKSQGVLIKVEEDKSVKLLIDELYRNNENISTLSVISECMNNYGEFYFKMTLKDWHKIVNAYITKISSDSSDFDGKELEDAVESVSYKVSENLNKHDQEEFIMQKYKANVPVLINSIVFSHLIDWSPFEYGFTIDKKYHEAIFNALGHYIFRGTGVDVKVLYDGTYYDAKISNADCKGRKGDTIRLLYKNKESNIGTILKKDVPEIYSYIKEFKDLYGGRKQCVLPKDKQRFLVFKNTEVDHSFIMEIAEELEDPIRDS